MSLIRMPRGLSTRQLALFGAVWLVLFGIVGAVLWRAEAGAAAGICWTVAVAVPAAGCIVPGLLRAVYLYMANATLLLGLLISSLLLAVVYYLILTLIGQVLRLWRHDPLTRRWDEKAATYWRPREEPGDSARYFRQF
jgi:hypothetical protein